jgi:glycosyltransferase involved in cell wall biosynthesis
MRIGIDASRAFVNERTGTENYSYQMIKNILQFPESLGHQWILYTKSSNDDQFSKLPNVHVQVISMSHLWTQIGLASRTWIDGIDCLWVPAHTLPVLRKPGLKTIVTIHGIEYEYLPSFQNPLQRWYLPLSTVYAVKSAEKLIAVSEFTKQQLVERLNADPGKITVIHEGTDIQNLKNNERRSEILKKYKLESKKYLLFIGTVQPRKNLKRLIDTFPDIQNKQIELVIIGKLGWGYEDLQINKQPGVKFLQYVDDDERDILLKSALAYVQPSVTEGFGLPILEAFSAGIPVVSSSGGALAEVVGDAGLLFDPFSMPEMKNQISKIVSDDDLRNKLIARGKQRLMNFSWKKAAQETYKILTGI